jgi:hypothetical protein
MSRSRAASAAAAAAIQVDVPCPSHAEYRDTGPAWPNHPNIGLQEGDEEQLRKILIEANNPDPRLKKDPLGRAVLFYKQLPSSYKNKLWKKAADHLIATRHDNLLAPDSDFLPTSITKPIWPGAEDCQTICLTEPERVCPWTEDCHTFYDTRKPQWNRQREHSRICHTRWILEEEHRRGDVALARRRETLAAKKKALRLRMEAEARLSAMMFEPEEFPNEKKEVEKITQGFPLKKGGSPRSLDPIIAQFRALQKSDPFTLLDFQCAIADYFHDGMPGFRISSTKDPKISGIRVIDLNMIRIGKERHHDFMYDFMSNVLHTINAQTPARLRRIKDVLIALQPHDASPIFTLPGGAAGDALNAWRNVIQLHGRIEDSLIPHLGLPSDESLADIYHTDLPSLKRKHPIHSYHAYLQSGKRRITVHVKKGEIDLLTDLEAQRVVTFLLFVLFGPSYEAQRASHPATFTFDAHKGHTNRLLAKSNLPIFLRLMTPYNVADSAMTEKFKNVDPDDEDLAEEIRGALSANDLQIKEDAKIGEDEEEEEDDTYTAAQKGDDRFVYTFNRGNARPFVVSDTNMIFDDNWLIYYKNDGFTQQHPYLFSMNLVDAGLHQYITDEKIKGINPSFYTVEAPFSTDITRGPSLNYLMMGLMRGSKSNVFPKQKFKDTNALYKALCVLYDRIQKEDNVKRLLPIYTIPPSSHSLPLFQHISSAPLFAYHMLYDLQHHISALPSRIKWAGDREQYMAIHGIPNSVFVTLDTTAYYCALANRVASLLERKNSIKLVGAVLDAATKGGIATLAAQTPQLASDPIPAPAKKGARGKLAASKLAASKPAASKPAASKLAGIGAQSKIARKAAEKGAQGKRIAYTLGPKKKTTGKGYMTRKNGRQSAQSMPGREYFFLNWLYPLTMSVNAAFYGHHAEHAYVLLQNLQKDISYPLLFPALQEQLIHAVSLIPNVPEDLMDAVKNITAETYDIVAPECLSRLEALYTSPRLSIFSQSVHKKTLLGYLREMKEKLSRRLSNDPTTNMLHILLTQDHTQDQEKACLALSLLFERLHGRIQNGTSYLGQILGITGGPDLECVDDQEVWEYLTDVITEDMVWITDLSRHDVPMEAMPTEAMPTENAVPLDVSTKANAPAVAPANVPVAPAHALSNAAALANAPTSVRNISAKLHRVNRGSIFHNLNRAFTQLRPKNARHATRMHRASRAQAPRAQAPRTQAARGGDATHMGGSMKTRRAKKGSRRSRQSRSHRKD